MTHPARLSLIRTLSRMKRKARARWLTGYHGRTIDQPPAFTPGYVLALSMPPATPAPLNAS